MKYSKAFSKAKKEIEELSDFRRGYHAAFWLGYIHFLFDYDKITEEEGVELEDFLLKE